jgi:hypothetical protein
MLEEKRQSILHALNNASVPWQQVDAIVKATSLPHQEVLELLDDLDRTEQIVKTTRKEVTVYATRQRYLKDEPLVNRILSNLAGEIK